MPELVLPPAGISPAVTWQPPTFAEPASPPALLADAIDPLTGEIASLTKRIHPVDAAIAEQFRLRRGTGSAVTEQGSDWHRIRHVTESTPRELEDEARRILRPFIERREVAAMHIAAEAPVAGGEDTGAVHVVYRNLITGKDVEVPA